MFGLSADIKGKGHFQGSYIDLCWWIDTIMSYCYEIHMCLDSHELMLGQISVRVSLPNVQHLLKMRIDYMIEFD